VSDILSPDEHATFMRDLDGCVPGSHIEHLRRHDTAQRARIDELEMALDEIVHMHPSETDQAPYVARCALEGADE
jgi:hypothetical protein